jgi:hypothetical protein
MDEQRFDAVTRQINASGSRRSVLGATLLAVGMATGWLASDADDAAARRTICKVRCGGERRQCRTRCRFKGIAAKDCRDACNITRDVCHKVCDFHPVRSGYPRGSRFPPR